MSKTQRVHIYKDEAGEWRWTALKSSDKVANSGEGYVNRSRVLEQVASLFPESDGWVYVVDGDA